jgi:hypothetical protein
MNRDPHRSRGGTVFRWAFVVLLGVPVLSIVLFVLVFSIGAHSLKHQLGFWVRVNLPEGFSGCTDLRFNVPGAPQTRAEHPLYVVDLPPDGRWYSSTNLNWGETLTFK